MVAYDVPQRVGSWIADVINTETEMSGEEIGYAVTWAAWPTPEGDAVTWTFAMTIRSPFLGKPDLAATTTVQVTVPSEAGVRHFAVTSLAKLRSQFGDEKRKGLSAGNGHGKLPPHVQGRLGQ